MHLLQKDHQSCGGAEARHSCSWWKHTSRLELTLISSVAAAELRCTSQAFCQIYWLRAHNLVNMMLPLLTFPTPVNIVQYRLTSQGPSSANRSPFCCFDLAALFLTKCFQFCTFGNNLKHLNLRFTVGGFVALLFPPGWKHGLLSVSSIYLLTKMQPRHSASLLPDQQHKSRCFLSSVCAHGHFSAAIFFLGPTPSMTHSLSAHTDPCTFFSPLFPALVYYNEETSFVKGKGCYKKGCYESKAREGGGNSTTEKG